MMTRKKKKLLVPEAEQALQKLQEDILRDLRAPVTPMREQFRNIARRIAEESESSSPEQ
ncbi:hypothetical protein [Sulfobacillus sp. hq2]|uniref:hypothetical protein n=1 Tax=Sulfobacillus TaxID=28033 RepID=UPI001304A820|nr:hypothetical protein [Sulfobacillus sp. hq2]